MTHKSSVTHVRVGTLPRRVRRVVCASTNLSNDSAVQKATSLLQTASLNKKVDGSEVYEAIVTLQKARALTEDWPRVLGGSKSPGNRWRLVFTSNVKQQKAKRGNYFPIDACQRWDGSMNQIENGVFLGHLATLTFKGPYQSKSNKLYFDFDTMTLKLGPWKMEFPLKSKIESYTPSPKDPFFVLLYVDDSMVVARGRSGGIAYWVKTTPQWELEHGIV